MAIIKCKMCGGDIELSADKTYGTCDSCGSTMTFPKVSDEQRANLFNRANHFRRQNEFDKAITAYERILDEDNTDAEAHWGVVLSRYGIEYVEDPATHERIPTCHRVQTASILTDPDYLAALEHAPDRHSAQLYRKEAQYIADIQKNILAISSQEAPYDVFICYKETTEGGARTKDSALAQDIYYQLMQSGYKVFFSRITLEEKLGHQYEPYIFAALNSARVMIVVGTRPEHLHAVWVKNEWSRYLALMKKDSSRLLIPCYRDMDPYDLPEELSALQSQDMSKIGFMQDLIRGIQKVLDGTGRSGDESGHPGVHSLLKRARLFLEDGDLASADSYAEKVLDIAPDCAEAYIIKTMVQRHLHTEEELGTGVLPLMDDAHFAKALRFASPNQKIRYMGYVQSVEQNIQQTKAAQAYQEAVTCFRSAQTEADFLKAEKVFSSLGSYEEAERLAAQSRAMAEKKRMEQQTKREAAEAQLRKNMAEKARQEEQKRIEKAKRSRQGKRLLAMLAAVIILIAGTGVLFKAYLLPKKAYDNAALLLQNQQYTEAISAFETLEGWGDSEIQIQTGYYGLAEQCLQANDLQQARAYYLTIPEYSDAAQKARNISDYTQARELYANGDIIQARKALALLNGFLDSAKLHDVCCQIEYDWACGEYEAGHIAAAYERFADLGSYSDSADKAAQIEAAYQTAQTLLTEQKYDEAIVTFEALCDYADSAERVPATRYEKAVALMNTGDLIGAEQAFALLGEYGDAKLYLKQVCLAIADQAFANMDYTTALAYYVKLPQTDELKAREYTLAQTCYEVGAYEQATQAYEILGQYELSVSRLPVARFAYASQLFEQGDYRKAAEQFSLLENFADSALRMQEALYQHGLQQMEWEAYEEAKAAFEQVAGYQDAKTLMMECDYRQASALMSNGSYAAASAIFQSLNDYQDSQAKMQECEYLLAEALFAQENYQQAQVKYAFLKDYRDSADKVVRCLYLRANQLFASGNYVEAETLYLAVNGYEDSAARIQECKFRQGMALYESGDYQTALTLFTTAEHADSARMAAMCHFALGKAEQTNGALEAAIAAYAQAVTLQEAQNGLYTIGKDYATINQNEKAIETLWYAGEDALSQELLKELAKLMEQNEKPVLAMAAYHAVLNSKDAVQNFDRLAKELSLSEVKSGLASFTITAGEYGLEHSVMYAYACKALENTDYDKAIGAFETITGYLDADEMHQEAWYQKAQYLMQNGLYDEAQTILNGLGAYKDAADLSRECSYQKALLMMQNQQYTEAISLLETIADYSDSQTQILECLYQIADGQLTAGEYASAQQQFADLAGYRDSATKEKECIYQQALIMLEAGDYDNAKGAFEALDSYGDSQTLSCECTYRKALLLMQKQQYAEAVPLLETIPEYKDSQTQILECLYQIADALFAAGEYASAQQPFADLGDYRDSVTKEKECIYQQGVKAFENADYEAAQILFASLGDYSDAAERVYAPHYELALQALAASEYDRALLHFELAKGYQDSFRYADAEKLFAAGRYNEAVAQYEKLKDTPGVALRINMIKYAYAASYEANGNLAHAALNFRLIDDYSDAHERAGRCYYELAEQQLQKGAIQMAAAYFTNAGDYKDAETRAKQLCYQQAKKQLANGKITAAKEFFEKAGNYMDAAKQLAEINQLLAEYGKPINFSTENELANQQQATVHGLYAKYDQEAGKYQFMLDCTVPKGYKVHIFNPPKGSRFGFDKGHTTGERQKITFELTEKKLDGISEITINCVKSDRNRFFIFFNTSGLKNIK